MRGSRKSHSRVWVRRPGQRRLAEMSWADSLVTTGQWVSWRQVQPGLVTQNLSFHWGRVVECPGMVTSMLQVGKWMLTLDREATGLAEDWHLSGRSGSSHSRRCRHSDIHSHGCQIWWVLGATVMYGMPLDLVDGVSVIQGILMGMRGQRCGEVIENRRPAVSMCHLRKVTLISGSPGRAITDMYPPGGLCTCAGVRLGGGSPHQAHPAVGHHRLGHQDDVDTGVHRCGSHKYSLVKRRVEWLHIPVPQDSTVLWVEPARERRQAVGKLTGQGCRLHHVETRGGPGWLPGIKGCAGGAVRQDGALDISKTAAWLSETGRGRDLRGLCR